MMKRWGIFSLSRTLLVTVVASVALAVGALRVFGQVSVASPRASTAPTILLNGPSGDRFTLVHSADTGWQMHAGWSSEADGNSAQSTKAMLPTAGAQPLDERPPLARPLTVFIDGPTGFTFMYVLGEGWKFVGRLANGAR
jgi:hypothetical protein